jgi:uncharacterized protein
MSRRRSRASAVLLLALSVGVLAGTGLHTARAVTPADTTQAQLYDGAIPDDVVAASAATGHDWTPEAATYGVGSTLDQPVTMSDGKVLRVNIYYPTNPDGSAASGPFPVLLTQTVYGKGGAASTTATSSPTGGANTYLAERGYIEVVADVRGTGDSEGTFGLFDPVQTTDGVTLVHYASTLPHSTGTVGLYGPSYLGINQLFTAGAVGKNSPLKAIFPMVPATDIYRDTAFMGGIIDQEFDLAYLGAITDSLNVANPILDGVENGSPNVALIAEHAEDVAAYNAAFSAEAEADGDNAYDGDYWHARQPENVLANIVANGIPAYLVGGEYDIFQRGEPMDFAGLQNAYDGRSVSAPMTSGQATTGRYQLIDGPFTHLTGSMAAVDPLELEWFDTWLKNEDTGMGSTPTPLHYFDLGTNTYTETTDYPFTGETPTRYYFGPKTDGSGALSTNDGSLSPTAPSTGASDTMVWSPAGSPCGRSVDQWGIGVYSTVAQSAGVTTQPCTTDDRTTQAGPSALTYTTDPLPSARVLAGPISADIYATDLTTTDTQWVVEVEDVAPDGTSKPLTEGALLGSLRAIDPSQSWAAPGGEYLLPYHPYTRASKTPVVTGQQTRYQVEVFPTYSTIAKGDRIRITLSSSDSPHLGADSVQTADLVGGVYQVHTGSGGASSVELPLSAAPSTTGVTTSTGSGTSSAAGGTPTASSGSAGTGVAATAPASPSTEAGSSTGARGTAASGALAETGAGSAVPLTALGIIAVAAAGGAFLRVWARSGRHRSAT